MDEGFVFEETKQETTPSALCANCGLVHPPRRFIAPGDGVQSMTECVVKQRQVMAHLLKQIGEPGICKGCNAAIVWVTHKNGKKTPYTLEGQSHFADCPAAKEFGDAKV